MTLAFSPTKEQSAPPAGLRDARRLTEQGNITGLKREDIQRELQNNAGITSEGNRTGPHRRVYAKLYFGA
ncbi:hypothetical protein ANANG_G00307550 [Anguilla anguilla]|uniref:Uncharacterized protein n=1 Tax=Anguilla anguilla TaxID=7936 RepID=A0A9D3LHW4_ANGAN|nr:hypothetical protein ANANG_G00307550 [Anguilla anguilla]